MSSVCGRADHAAASCKFKNNYTIVTYYVGHLDSTSKNLNLKQK